MGDKYEGMLQNHFMNNCDDLVGEVKLEPFVLVIFGGTGDLSRRKLMPALYRLFCEGKIDVHFSILGLGSRSRTDEEFRQSIHDALKEFSAKYFKEEDAQAFIAHLCYQSYDLSDGKGFSVICERVGELKKQVDGQSHTLYYLAIPPRLLPDVIKQFIEVRVCGELTESKIVIEKPFGRDRQTAIELNRLLSQVFSERQVYRMDHYLGKDTVQNLLFFRFGNSIFEPLWNRNYIDHVQITFAEDIGIEGRGNFYEQSGVIRDVVQNHLLQVLSLIAMEPPVGFHADFIRDEKVKVYRTIRPIKGDDIDQAVVLGQYTSGTIKGQKVGGYREQEKRRPGLTHADIFCRPIFYRQLALGRSAFLYPGW